MTELLINHAGKTLLRLRARECDPIDQKPGGSGNPRLHPLAEVLLDVCAVFAVGQAGIELFVIQLQIASAFEKSLAVELSRIEELVMILPVLSLFSGAARGLRRNFGLRMNLLQR